MEPWIIEIAPHQVIRWLRDEIAARPETFEIRAERDFVAADLEDAEAAGLSKEVETEIREGAAVGLLEVRPASGPKDWVLRLRAEDELAAHVPLDHSVGDTPEEIDLDTFEALFVTPDRAAIDVTLEVDIPQTKHRLQPLIEDIRNDRHPGLAKVATRPRHPMEKRNG